MTENNPYREFTTGLIEQLLELSQYEKDDFRFKHLYSGFPDIDGSRQESFFNQLKNHEVISNFAGIKQEFSGSLSSLNHMVSQLYGDNRPDIGLYCTVNKEKLHKFATDHQLGTIGGRVQYGGDGFLSKDELYLFVNDAKINLQPKGTINNKWVLAKVLFNSYDLSITMQNIKDDGSWTKIDDDDKLWHSIKYAVYSLNKEIKALTRLTKYIETNKPDIYVNNRYR